MAVCRASAALRDSRPCFGPVFEPCLSTIETPMSHHPSKLILNVPLNSLSLGNVSYNIIRELYRRKINCIIFPKGQVDLSAYKIDATFNAWLERSISDRFNKVDRHIPTLSVWHIQDSQFKPSDRQYLFSFFETDSPTSDEVNVINQQDHTFFSSNWSVSNFQQYGANNVSFVPLGLDEDFQVIPTRQVSDQIIHWGAVGKVESRKNTVLIVQEWVKRYGDNPKHQLTLAITNPFLQPEHMNTIYGQCFMGKQKPFNVNILPRLKTNQEMNRLYNSFDVDIGASSSEGWNLPSFTATALGKWSIVTNCSAHKDWATIENAILIEPTDMRPVYDGVHFHEGQPFSQGNVYTVTATQLDEAFTRAEKVAKTPNPAGRRLATEFTYKRTVDEILKQIPTN